MKLVIDIGSNTSKCLLGKIENGKIEKLFEKTLECRICVRKGILVENVEEMLTSAISCFLEQAKNISPKFECIAVATSALRESPLREQVIKRVFARTNVLIKILSGEDEARLSFAGACSDNALPQNQSSAFFDLGGGSLEVAFGEEKKLISAESFPLGAVSLTNMFRKEDDKDTPEVIENIASYIDKNLNLNFNYNPDILIGVGGAVAAARLMNEKINAIKSNKITVSEIERFIEIIEPMPVEERIAKFGVPKSRADILVAAFVCIVQLAKKLKFKEIYHTFNNLRYGLILEASDLNK